MADLIIQGVKIFLPAEYAQDTTIGLYTESNVSSLRWSEATLTGVAESWATGIILKNGIGDIVASGDLSRGGNVADYSGLTISAANAESLMQTLKDLQINMIGFRAIVTEFIGTLADSDATSRTVRFTGVVENISWGDTELTIALKNSYYKRESNLSVVNENGTVTPVCFGNLKPALTEIIDGAEVTKTKVDCLAKFVRTKDKEDDSIYTNAYFDTGATLPLVKIFPVTNVVNNTQVVFQISGTSFAGTITPVDVYMIENGGQIRQVTSIVGTGINNLLSAYVKDVFLTDLVTSGDARTWIQFVKIKREYSADAMACKDFLKAEDGTATSTPELYTYDSDADKYNRIADFGLTVKDSAQNNSLDIDGSQYQNDVDSLESFLILPATSLALETSADLTQWPGLGDSYALKEQDGIYSRLATGAMNTITGGTLADPTNAYDKNSTTFATFSPTINYSGAVSGRKYCIALKFGLPKIDKDINVDKIYVGIKGVFNILSGTDLENDGKLTLALRRFAYTKTTDYKQFVKKNTTIADPNIDDLPDYYYSDLPTTNSLNFYKPTTISSGEWDTVFGYTNFELSGITVNDYNTYIEGGILLEELFAALIPFGGDYVNTLKIYEVAIIVKLTTSSIKKEVYSPLSGRVFGDTWESRKTAANLMENPVDIIEHCRRLGNWSEYSPIAYDWGHEYAVTEDPIYYDKIKTGAGDGSFDSANLNYLTDQKVAIEITSADKANNTEIVKRLCNGFDLCSYIDMDGLECVETLQLTNPTGAENTILLTDQIGAIGNVEEPDVQNIYCEPLIKYAFDQGSGEYTKALKITHIDAAVYSASYSDGFTGSDGETVWNTCKTLYNQIKQVEVCPADFYEQPLVADYSTALALLYRKIAWMTKMRLPTITIAYSKGKSYNIYKHLMIQLPMHTNNVSVECIIEKITKSKNTGTVKIDCVILGNVENAYYDTNYSTNELADNAATGTEIQDQ